MSSHVVTLGPKYIPYSYMEPALGLQVLGVPSGGTDVSASEDEAPLQEQAATKA